VTGAYGLKVVVDFSRCQGHGRCYDLAPDVFEPDERGRVALAISGELPAALQRDAEIGVRNCPESALALVAAGPAVSGGRRSGPHVPRE
jgi:ferredoxin